LPEFTAAPSYRDIGVDFGNMGRMRSIQNAPARAKTAALLAAFFFGGISATSLLAPPPALAGSAVNVIYGYVQHISSSNIKVYDVNGKQSLGFEIVPKFDQVFSSDGKTTYQMKNLKSGDFVKVYYDTKFLGVRHADRIFVYATNSMAPTGRQ